MREDLYGWSVIQEPVLSKIASYIHFNTLLDMVALRRRSIFRKGGGG